MLTIPPSHSTFRSQLDASIQAFPADQRSRLTKDPALRSALAKVRRLNLDPLSDILQPLYPSTGRVALHQVEIFRSLFLMFHFKITSIDLWHQKLLSDPLLSSLSGFFSRIPSVGRFYNFITRLYNQPDTPKIQAADLNKKPHQKLKKGQKWENSPKNKVASALESLSCDGYPQKDRVILNILARLAVLPSADLGLIDMDNFNFSGDGTAIHVHADSRGHSIKGDPDHRRYSDPDANIGWDSDLGSYFFGYHGYFCCVHSTQYKTDLPVFLELNQASVHDAVPGVSSLFGFRTLFPQAKVKAVCFDSAHDNEATYAFIESIGAKPFIDPNVRSKRKASSDQEYLDPNGNMICKAGIPMYNVGWDRTNQCTRFQCPCKIKKSGVEKCPLSDPCSSRPKGRIINYRPDSLRNKYLCLRHQDSWKSVYKNRTSCERVNNRILNDYRLHQTKVRGRKRLLIHILMGFINIHTDAWLKIDKPQANVI